MKEHKTLLISGIFLLLFFVAIIGLSISNSKMEEETSLQTPSEGEQFIGNVNPPVEAPEIRGITNWINSDGETLQELEGKVVLIDFWTYSCINCIRTLPYLAEWHEKYEDDGLVIVGLHAPEFAFEKELSNVQNAVEDYEIKYPVGLDNDYATWRAYENRYWPAKYFIDREGNLRHTHFGEGKYSESELVIQELLKEGGEIDAQDLTVRTDGDQPPISSEQTHETYLGYARAEKFTNKSEALHDEIHSYTLSEEPEQDYWSLGGMWEQTDEKLISREDGAQLTLTFSAKEVYLVMSAATESPVKVEVDNNLATIQNLAGEDVNSDSVVLVLEPDLYRIIGSSEFLESRTLKLTIPSGVELNAFTFGS
ncbi:thioredoxin family protein [Candidatus Dojkabacteria bacterium]|uniref:Thioredoxin family protein n=1 Tax=Candidatus Dojkabacteria bacterium TaxID=2099670 RepID=A0A955L8A2_9BACT|nr:thioredoxin family protein [Candidatus Dojkabacteria bacterium]